MRRLRGDTPGAQRSGDGISRFVRGEHEFGSRVDATRHDGAEWIDEAAAARTGVAMRVSAAI